MKYKLFCDESCHLEHDSSDIMVLGSLCCPADMVKELVCQIKKLRHTYNYRNELKWTKQINCQLPFYKELIDLFHKTDGFRFKATVVLNKNLLNHSAFNHNSHNNFYYKMFYYTLRDFLNEGDEYRIYLDYMDTRGGAKIKKLEDVLRSDKGQRIKIDAQVIRSHESQLIQFCDLFIGAVAYANRKDIPKSSDTKNAVINYLEQMAGRSLSLSTPQWEDKFNLFLFSPRRETC